MAETTGSKLNALRQRAGLSLAEIASAAGFKGPSSVQQYFSSDYEGPLKLNVADRFSKVFEGRGSPPIDWKEIFDLTEQARYDRDSHGHSRRPRTLFEPAVDPLFASNSLRSSKGVSAFYSDLTEDKPFERLDGGVAPIEITLIDMIGPVSYVRRPPSVTDEREIYLVYLSGSSMAPRYRPGDPIFVDPKRPPAIGDDVVVRLAGDTAAENMQSLVKTLIGRSSTHLILEQYQPAAQFQVPVGQIAKIHRVIPWPECLGL